MTTTTHTGAHSRRQRGPAGFIALARTRTHLDRSWHLWIGPLGAHIFWPDLHKSRPAWCGRWREPVD